MPCSRRRIASSRCRRLTHAPQGKDVWTLITNDIDHEKIHTGQVLEGRYESKITASFHVAKHTLVVAQDFLNTMAADQAARGHSTRG